MERTTAFLQIGKRWAVLLCIGSMLPLTATRIQATEDEMALALRQNVVRIETEWKSDGFGFIVGERGGFLYIATANHVVRGTSPEQGGTSPFVSFFEDQTNYRAQLDPAGWGRDEGDIAVLRVPVPASGITWRRDALAAGGVKERTTDVWFIGRQREWFVPAMPGRVTKIAPIGTIVSEGLSVRVGTSGAPLVSKDGIIGMIIEDRGTEVDATPVDIMQRAFVSRNLPWQLVPARAAAPEARSFTVDLTEFHGRQKSYQIRGNMTIQAFLNDLYFEINKTAKMAQFQYGKRWILEDVQSGTPFRDIGGGTDHRPLTELKITPGSTLKVRKLK
jgi:hypothetical protein